MSDLISRKQAIDEVYGAIYEFFDICDDDEESPVTYKDERLLELNKAITIQIKQLPTAEKTGKWELVDEAEPRRYGCSCCKRLSYTMDNYCSYCGARMVD